MDVTRPQHNEVVRMNNILFLGQTVALSTSPILHRARCIHAHMFACKKSFRVIWGACGPLTALAGNDRCSEVAAKLLIKIMES
uniref:Uncharacterized protein n=1 Tax=Romanomermis culicivorax TaxID=13658 RepID=A0A915HX29_ROMCU